jgi:hypothetical protein
MASGCDRCKYCSKCEFGLNIGMHLFNIGNWSVYTRERSYHDNRLRTGAYFEFVSDQNNKCVIYPVLPTHQEDDCNGDEFLIFLNWLKDHPIDRHLSNWKLDDVTDDVFSNTNNKFYDATPCEK